MLETVLELKVSEILVQKELGAQEKSAVVKKLQPTDNCHKLEFHIRVGFYYKYQYVLL